MQNPLYHLDRAPWIRPEVFQNSAALLQSFRQEIVSDLGQQIVAVTRRFGMDVRCQTHVVYNLACEGRRVDGLGDLAVTSSLAGSFQIGWISVGGESDDGGSGLNRSEPQHTRQLQAIHAR